MWKLPKKKKLTEQEIIEQGHYFYNLMLARNAAIKEGKGLPTEEDAIFLDELDYFVKKYGEKYICPCSTEKSEIQQEHNGLKADAEKDQWNLLPLAPIEQVVKVLTYGANKYAPENWRNVESERYVAALFRHIVAWRKGEKFDEETSLHHLAHAICNLIFLMELENE